MQLRSILVGLAFTFVLRAPGRAAEITVAIRSDFPGGNVVVEKVDGSTVHLRPDLRGGPPWFYWHFEARADRPGTVTFLLADPPQIAARGPAVSEDGGRSWRWLGADRVTFAPRSGDKTTSRHDRFSYTFARAGQGVRFAVAIPYLQHDLEEFLDRHRGNPHLTRGALTQSRLGRRTVDLVRVGAPGPDVRAVLVTARHHACESMASYVLEGLLQEALSDSPAGAAFRRRFVLYAVPIVDRDGVEMGDPGKNRRPRDYNRDYGPDSIHPEIKAIKELGELRNVRYSLDLHCPFVRGDIHEAFHFVGLGLPHIKDNLKEWTAWLNEERPPAAMTPLDLLKDPRKSGAEDRTINSHYFATRPGAVFSVCLEVPYAQANCPLDAAMARAYGASMLRAWIRTRFVAANEPRDRGDPAHADLLALRTQFLKTYRSKPKDAEASAAPHLDPAAGPLPYRAEANNLMALLRLHQGRFAEALRYADTADQDVHATTAQKATALLTRVQIVCGAPGASAGDVDAALARWQRLPYTSTENQARVYEIVSECFRGRRDLERALDFARRQLAVARVHEQGRVLIRVADLEDLLGRPQDAVASRKEAVRILRARLGSTPERSIFGALMTVDLFDALQGIPSASPEEKRAAGAWVLGHEIVSPALKARVRQALAESENREKE